MCLSVMSFCLFDLIWVGAIVYTLLGQYAQFSMKDYLCVCVQVVCL